MKDKVRQEWAGELIKQMFLNNVTRNDISEEMGTTAAYITMVLHAPRTTEKTKQNVLSAFQRVLDKHSSAQ